MDHLSFEVAGITSQKMFASWLKTFLAKIDEIREKSSGKSELVLLAVRYIKNHCLESLRLETVAEELAVSPNYLSTIIKKETGITFQPIFPDLVCQFFTVCLHMDAVLVPVVKYKSDPLT